MLVYVDDIIHLAHGSKEDMDTLNCTYIFKEESVAPTKRYLGANVEKIQV